MKRLLLLALALLVCACNRNALTREEAYEALDESSIESQSNALTATPVEISTHFTIGGAVQNAAAELRAFLAAELPCANVTVQGSTVTTEWGAAGGSCAYKGQVFSGTTSVTIIRVDAATVDVTHTFIDFSNGRVKVNGGAQVTWSSANFSRHVVHDLTWTRLRDNRTGHGTGDRTQVLMDPALGIAGGIRIDGNRRWTGERGAWDLAITAVEVRPQDPVPQAGIYTLTTPDNKVVTLSFSRLSADVIRVTIKGPKHDFSFNVTSIGAIQDV